MNFKFQDGVKIVDNKKCKNIEKNITKNIKMRFTPKGRNDEKKQKQYKVTLEAADKYGDLVYNWINEKIKHYEKQLKKGK